MKCLKTKKGGGRAGWETKGKDFNTSLRTCSKLNKKKKGNRLTKQHHAFEEKKRKIQYLRCTFEER